VKPSWSSTGEYFIKAPSDTSVPAWLHTLFGPKAASTEDQEPASLHIQSPGQIYFTELYGVTYVQITDECRSASYHEIDEKRRQVLLFQVVAIIVQAYPVALAELTGDEIQLQLLRVVEDCILPLLALVTDEDIISWLSPRE
jgi:hypothetical protein